MDVMLWMRCVGYVLLMFCVLIKDVVCDGPIDTFRKSIGAKWQGYYSYQGQHVTFTFTVLKVIGESNAIIEGRFQDEGGANFKVEGEEDYYSPDGANFRVLHDGSTDSLLARFAPGDWSLSGSVIDNQDGTYTFSGVNPAEDFGTFTLDCTPPPPTPVKNVIEEQQVFEATSAASSSLHRNIPSVISLPVFIHICKGIIIRLLRYTVSYSSVNVSYE